MSFAEPGPLTALTADQVAAVRRLDLDPRGLCRVAQGLLVDPEDAFGTSLSPQQLAERNTRSAGALLRRAAELHPAPFDQPRPPTHRVVGTWTSVAVSTGRTEPPYSRAMLANLV